METSVTELSILKYKYKELSFSLYKLYIKCVSTQDGARPHKSMYSMLGPDVEFT